MECSSIEDGTGGHEPRSVGTLRKPEKARGQVSPRAFRACLRSGCGNKHRRLGGSHATESYSSQFWRLDVQRQAPPRPGESPLPDSLSHFMWQTCLGSSVVSLVWEHSLVLSTRAAPSVPEHQRYRLLIARRWDCWGDTHVQTIAERNRAPTMSWF